MVADGYLIRHPCKRKSFYDSRNEDHCRVECCRGSVKFRSLATQLFRWRIHALHPVHIRKQGIAMTKTELWATIDLLLQTAAMLAGVWWLIHL
jgi:hypothetical protein